MPQMSPMSWMTLSLMPMILNFTMFNKIITSKPTNKNQLLTLKKMFLKWM